MSDPDDWAELDWREKWCAWCGETLPAERHGLRKFCYNDRACETAYHNDIRAQRLAEARAGKTCALCGEPFVAKKAYRIYCSRKCACRASSLRNRDRINARRRDKARGTIAD